MDYSELKSANPRLFWDGVCRGSISYSTGGALVTGDAAKTPLIEGLLGGPKPPEESSFNPLTTSIIGPGSGYPKPWRSGSQFTQNASYGSQIGPYAKLVRLPDGDYVGFDDTCVGGYPGQCGGPYGGIYGRLGIGDGVHLGFRAQDWYNQDEGTYDTAYWNTQNDTDWLTWKKWWDGATKTTIEVIWYVDQVTALYAEAEVANDTPDIGDTNYFPGPNLNGVANASYDLLTGMVATAIVARWII